MSQPIFNNLLLFDRWYITCLIVQSTLISRHQLEAMRHCLLKESDYPDKSNLWKIGHHLNQVLLILLDLRVFIFQEIKCRSLLKLRRRLKKLIILLLKWHRSTFLLRVMTEKWFGRRHFSFLKFCLLLQLHQKAPGRILAL